MSAIPPRAGGQVTAPISQCPKVEPAAPPARVSLGDTFRKLRGSTPGFVGEVIEKRWGDGAASDYEFALIPNSGGNGWWMVDTLIDGYTWERVPTVAPAPVAMATFAIAATCKDADCDGTCMTYPTPIDSPLGLPVEGTARPEPSALEAAWAKVDAAENEHRAAGVAANAADDAELSAWHRLHAATQKARNIGPRPEKDPS